MTPSEMRLKLWRLSNTVAELARETIRENPQVLTSLIVDQQYDKGIDGEGNPLSPYSSQYLKRKERLGISQGHTDFHLTGTMQANMVVEVTDSEYDISSSTEVPGYILSDLLKKRDPLSFELTAENKEIVRGELTPIFEAKVGEWMNG